jgi:hypothetical protein
MREFFQKLFFSNRLNGLAFGWVRFSATAIDWGRIGQEGRIAPGAMKVTWP